MVGAGLIGLAAVLGLKRRNDKKKARTERSDISSSYYTDSYTGTSASKFLSRFITFLRLQLTMS